MSPRKTITPAAFPALAEAPVRRYLYGQTASVVGSWTQNITLNLLLWEMTHAAWQLGLLNFLLQGPSLLVSPLFGSRLSSTGARTTTFRILLCSLVVAATLSVANFFDLLRPALVIAAALVCGMLAAMEMPTRQLLLTTTLRNQNSLGSVIALNTLVFNVGRMIGPVIAAYLFMHIGASSGFALNVVGLTTMLLCIQSLPIDANLPTSSVKTGGLRHAIAYARADSLARQCLPALALLGLLAGSYQTLIPVLSHRFGDAPRFTGVFFGCAGAGAMLAALLLSSPLMNTRRAMQAHGAAQWLAVLALGGISLASTPWLAGVGFCTLGLSLTFFATTTNSTLQRNCPSELRGGIVGLYGMAYLGTMPLGHLLMGNAANLMGEQAAFGIMAISLALGLGALRLIARRRASTEA